MVDDYGFTTREKKNCSILSQSFLLSMILSQTCLTTFLAARKMFSQIYLLCGSHNKVKRLRLKFVSLLEASVGQHDFTERVSQFYLFVEENVILTHVYFAFFYN